MLQVKNIPSDLAALTALPTCEIGLKQENQTVLIYPILSVLS